MKRKTHEEYLYELSIKNKNVIAIEPYIDANTKIMHRCLIHNVDWQTTPTRALKGVGCEECRKEKFAAIRTKTHNQYVEEVKMVSPYIEVLEKYVDAKTPILHFCKIHNVEWNTYPDNILHGHGCWECQKDKARNKNSKTFDDYIKALKTINPNIKCIGKYKKATEHVLHKCLIDGYEWYAIPSSILHGRGCPKCGGSMLKTQEEYVIEVANINPNIEVGGNYVNAKTPLLHKCKIDGYEWYAVPSSILSGCGCPQCNESKGERSIKQWLRLHNIAYIPQKSFSDCKDKRPLPFDYYLPDYNMVIEYDGEQHYRPVEFFGGIKHFKQVIKHDGIKNDYCKSNNISLLRIPYYKNVDIELNKYFVI